MQKSGPAPDAQVRFTYYKFLPAFILDISSAMSRRKPSKENVKQSASSYFSGALDKCRQETTNNGVTEKEFMNCLLKALGKDSDIPIKSVSRRRCSCSCVMKVLWIMFLAVLAFSLFVAAYSPLAFFVQKVW